MPALEQSTPLKTPIWTLGIFKCLGWHPDFPWPQLRIYNRRQSFTELLFAIRHFNN